MKLRNKKTGKVFDVIVREKSNGDGEYSIIVCNLRALRSARSVSSILGEYDSLAKFNEDWEDYKPTEPLIKDEKIRKAVRAWAEALKVDTIRFERFSQGFLFGDGNVYSSINFDGCVFDLADGKEYTITELCGEEK